ncbi:hypothetical protein KC19_3G021100 [Ceratodon purpureus]|uniref:Uncharacterized protein n=1 Tax=Ceratodon purpureus TaxID=3225 RepID=A0A8T0IEY3_CERPU|nr:hypothetical protein KC19_3G021100 [Ceratodon purpureus]
MKMVNKCSSLQMVVWLLMLLIQFQKKNLFAMFVVNCRRLNTRCLVIVLDSLDVLVTHSYK